MAVTLTMVFFYINKRWLSVPTTELYHVARDVAASQPKDKDLVINTLVMFFSKYEEKLTDK